jgi:hypothetical protein
MTTDARALIAEWVRQEESFDNPASTVEYGRAQNWIRTNLSALLTGYSAALDEVERLRPVEPWVAELQKELDALRTELGEVKLVIEQQDRDLERMRAGLTEFREAVEKNYDDDIRRSWVRDQIDDILERTPCTDTTTK